VKQLTRRLRGQNLMRRLVVAASAATQRCILHAYRIDLYPPKLGRCKSSWNMAMAHRFQFGGC
jgi:hypothetical protein